MKKILLLSTFALLIVLYGCGGNEDNEDAGSSNEEPITLTVNTVWPENNFMSEGLIEYSNIIEENTDGRVIFDVKTGGALGYEGAELLSAVKDNLVPVSEYLAFGVEGDEPLYGLSTLPFLVKDIEENRILNDIARPYYDKIAEEKWNQKILYVATWPGAGFWTKNKIESPADLEGIQMRTADGNGAKVVQSFGGVPYQMAFSEVYSSLATGAIDSVLTSSPTAVDSKFWEVLDYYVPVNVTMGVSFVTINLDEFEKLSEEDQETLVQLGEQMEESMWDKVKEIEEENLQTSTENGIEVIEPSDELMNELSNITEDLRSEWIENAPEEAKEIIDIFNEEVSNNGN